MLQPPLEQVAPRTAGQEKVEVAAIGMALAIGVVCQRDDLLPFRQSRVRRLQRRAGVAQHRVRGRDVIVRAQHFRDAQFEMIEINVGAAAVAEEFPAPVLRIVGRAVLGHRTLLAQRLRRRCNRAPTPAGAPCRPGSSRPTGSCATKADRRIPAAANGKRAPPCPSAVRFRARGCPVRNQLRRASAGAGGASSAWCELGWLAVVCIGFAWSGRLIEILVGLLHLADDGLDADHIHVLRQIGQIGVRIVEWSSVLRIRSSVWLTASCMSLNCTPATPPRTSRRKALRRAVRQTFSNRRPLASSRATMVRCLPSRKRSVQSSLPAFGL